MRPRDNSRGLRSDTARAHMPRCHAICNWMSIVDSCCCFARAALFVVQLVLPSSVPSEGSQTKYSPSINCSRSFSSKPIITMDAISIELAEHAADSNLSAEALANMEVNMRRISQESASPTVKGGKNNLSVGGSVSNHNSFSLSLLTDDQLGHHIMRSR
jgi:hypothetical protein